MRRIFKIAVAVLAAVALNPVPVHAGQQDPVPGPVLSAQYVLRKMGYAVPVSGVDDWATSKALVAWQKSNGLKLTGDVNPATLKSLGLTITGAIRDGIPAERLNQGELVAGALGAPSASGTLNEVGLRGMPFAPSSLSGCEEMAWYAAQAGLPDFVNVQHGSGGFDDLPTREQSSFAEQAIGRRESGCDNTSANSCCYGYWQIHAGNLSAPGYKPFTSYFCEATSRYDIWGDAPLQKQKQACVAKVLYDFWASGLTSWPWRL